MKKISFLILINLCFNIVKGQITKTLNMPKIREKKEIDNLVREFIYLNSSPNLKNNYSIVIDINTTNGRSLFSLFSLDSVHKKTIYTSKKFIIKQKNFRYFEYKNHFFFVCGDIDSYNLFRFTNKKKGFLLSLVNDNKNINVLGNDFTFIYENGTFKPMVPFAHKR